MNIIEKYIAEIKAFELIDHDNGHYTNLMPLSEAIDILQRFELALLDELDCEQLEKLQNERKGLS